MGNLHAGHISLVTAAKKQCDYVVASIFVNPMQFGEGEDLDSYPRTFDEDKAKLEAAGCDALFFPSVEEMYPNGMGIQTTVSVPELSNNLCGASRPGHFDGVTTVVSKLFNMVQPDKAYFGEKDFQQLAIIRKMVSDLNIPVKIKGVPIARDHDQLALSSRNGYLSPPEREVAPSIYKVLQYCKASILTGNYDYEGLCKEAKNTLKNNGFEVDYFEICNSNTLQKASPKDLELGIFAAASLGNTRLIDNVTLILN